jgi:hypothetical protein
MTKVTDEMVYDALSVVLWAISMTGADGTAPTFGSAVVADDDETEATLIEIFRCVCRYRYGSFAKKESVIEAENPLLDDVDTLCSMDAAWL